MTVTVHSHGVMKELLGSLPRPVELPDGSDVDALLRWLKARYSPEHTLWGSIAVGVDDDFAPRTRVLQDGDEVDLMPPVSGGLLAD